MLTKGSYFILLAYLLTSLVNCTSEERSDSGNLESDAGQRRDSGTMAETELWQAKEVNNCESGDYRSPSSITLPEVSEFPLIEISGITASWQQEDLYWIHNDSGNQNRVYAIDTEGQIRADFLVNINNNEKEDLEEISTGLCPQQNKPCLYLFNTGDNAHSRDFATIYIYEEPLLNNGSTLEHLELPLLHEIKLSYPDTAINVEAAFVTPDGTSIYLFEKAKKSKVSVFKLDLATALESTSLDTPNTIITASKIGELNSPGLPLGRKSRLLTAADIHPNQNEVILRTYTGIYRYPLSNQNIAGMLSQSPETIALPINEFQGEAISYSTSGEHILSISEDPKQQRNPPLHFYQCE